MLKNKENNAQFDFKNLVLNKNFDPFGCFYAFEVCMDASEDQLMRFFTYF